MELIQEIIRVRSRCCLVTESGRRYWLRTDDLQDADYSPGTEVKLEDLEHFVLLHQYPRALSEAVAMLARRPCSRGEIEQKLNSRHYSGQTVEMVLYKLQRENLLNDADFSAQWVRYRAGQRYGSRRILQELRHKGVSEEDAREALEQLSDEEVLEQAAAAAEKGFRRLKPGESLWDRRQKVLQSLVRRGYDWDTAKAACEEAVRRMDEEGKE